MDLQSRPASVMIYYMFLNTVLPIHWNPVVLEISSLNYAQQKNNTVVQT